MKFTRWIFICMFLVSSQVGIVRADPETTSSNTTLFFPVVMNSAASPGWIGPDGGSVLGLVVDPGDENIVYAGTFGAGMFKSTDGGATWNAINNGLLNPKIQSLAIDPATPSTIYAGTYRDETGGGNEGVYKSTDGGQTWHETSSGLQSSVIVYSIAINAQNPSQIYLTTRGQSNGGINPWKGKVYRSDNGGGLWIELTGMSSVGGSNQEDWGYSVVVHPQYPNQVYIATHEHGPWWSTDYGNNWVSKTNGINSNDLNGRSIVVDPFSGATPTLYFGVWKAVPGVYRSVDGGTSWQQKNNGTNGTTVYGLSINPDVNNELFIASFKNGIYKTTNFGDNWSQSGLTLNKTWIVSLAPSNPQALFTGTFGDGVYKSADGGASWFHAQAGIQNAWITGLASIPGSSTERYLSLNGGGILHSSDGGHTWVDFNQGLPDKYINGLTIDPSGSILYALTDTHGLYSCDLTSGQWSASRPALPKAMQETPLYPEGHPLAGGEMLEGDVTPSENPDLAPESPAPSTIPLVVLKIAPSNPNVMYLGTQASGGCTICGVYRSADGGANWSYRNLAGMTIYSLAIDPSNPDRVYAATSTSGVVKTTSNGGLSWSDLSISGRSVYSLVMPAASGGILSAGTDSGVYAWNGSGWSAKGLTGSSISSLAAHPTVTGLLFAGTTNGAFYSTDGGNNWNPGPAGLQGLTIQSIDVEPASGLVYYGTTTRGIYQDRIP